MRLSSTLSALFCYPLLFITTLQAGAEWTPLLLESGENRVSLLELYTSEGCSSCPPAEEWLSQLKTHSDLWKSFVPVSFHVDYWNSLGWPDPYSSEEYTSRQRAYGAAWNSATIYTPEFVLNGREWRAMEQGLPNSEKSPGILRASLSAEGKLEIHFTPHNQTMEALLVEVALLADGINSRVPRGENMGRTLHHDFLTVALLKAELNSSKSGCYETTLILPSQTKAPACAIAIWVRFLSSFEPLQATGGWLKIAHF